MRVKKSCETCKYFVPPTYPSRWHPGDPWECQEPNIGPIMTAKPPVKKRYCKRWVPNPNIQRYKCFECGNEYFFLVPDPYIPWSCEECGGPLMIQRDEDSQSC